MTNNIISNSNNIVAIVDAYSIGRFYAPAFQEKGYRCIHIQSNVEIPKLYQSSFIPNNFMSNLIYDGSNLSEILSELKKHNTQFVIAGSEPGVEFADLLGHEMNLSTSNPLVLSEARRNKFKMIEAVKEKGLSTAEHIKSNNVADIVEWAKARNTWPIVLKQLKGGGSERVFFCHNESEIIKNFSEYKNTKDQFGNENIEVLAESYLEGGHYLVNVVSRDGQHMLSDFWYCKKFDDTSPNSLMDYLKLLPYNHAKREQVANYTFKALDALGINYGPTHNEVIYTKNGPALLECGARIMGAVDPTLISKALAESQLDLTLDCYLNPAAFVAKAKKPYDLGKHFLYKFIITNARGTIKKVNFIKEIESLKSFLKMNLTIKPGAVIKETNDLWTSPGAIYLCHEDEAVVDEDYRKIASFEKEMFEV